MSIVEKLKNCVERREKWGDSFVDEVEVNYLSLKKLLTVVEIVNRARMEQQGGSEELNKALEDLYRKEDI